MPTWHLDNAEELASQYRYTFYRPSPSVLARIAPGDCVKLIFRFEGTDPGAPAAERMWCWRQFKFDHLGVRQKTWTD